ncbi:MAG: ABC transporter permease [Chloroflexi bacterium]|nr:ABC transporter permease [Chloroflexota bacterium]
MRRIWTIARHEYLVNVRRPTFLLLTAAVPVLGVIGLIVAAFYAGQVGNFFEKQFSGEPEHVGVVDQSGLFTPILADYRAQFYSYPDEGQARQALLAEKVSLYLLIPGDYLATGKVQVVTQGSGFGAATASESTNLRRFLVAHLLANKVEPAIRARAVAPLDAIPVVLGSEGKSTGETSSAFFFRFVVPYLLAVLLVITIFVSSGFLLQSVSEEKESRVIEIVLSSVTATQLLAGKVLGLGALGLTQILVWTVSSLALGGGAASLLSLGDLTFIEPSILLLAIVYYILGFTLYAVLMGSVGALGTTMRESQQLAGLFSFGAAVPYMLSGFLFTNPNALLARILSFFPLTAPTMMMLRLPLAEVPTVDIIGSLVVLVASIPVVLWAGAKVFRLGLLMYGQRPTLVQIWHTLQRGV